MAKDKKSKYGSLRGAVSSARDQLEKNSGLGALDIGDREFWKPEKGNNVFDIIPFVVGKGGFKPTANMPEGELFPQVKYRLHFNVGPDEKIVVCPTSIGEPCPICERRAEMAKDRDADEEELKNLKAKDRVAFNIIDLDNEKAGIQVFDLSPHLFANIFYEEIEAANGELDGVFDLDGGRTIRARFATKKLGSNSFLECTRVDFDERDAYDDDIVDEAIDLSSALNILPYKVLEAMLLGMPVDDEEEPQSRRESRSSSRKEEEEEPQGHSRGRSRKEEEEEEPPSRGRGRNRKEEEEQEPEPEPEPEPKEETRSRGRSRKEEEAEGECPHGFRFGIDLEKEEECDDCGVWKACRRAKDSK